MSRSFEELQNLARSLVRTVLLNHQVVVDDDIPIRKRLELVRCPFTSQLLVNLLACPLLGHPVQVFQGRQQAVITEALDGEAHMLEDASSTC